MEMPPASGACQHTNPRVSSPAGTSFCKVACRGLQQQLGGGAGCGEFGASADSDAVDSGCATRQQQQHAGAGAGADSSAGTPASIRQHQPVGSTSSIAQTSTSNRHMTQPIPALFTARAALSRLADRFCDI